MEINLVDVYSILLQILYILKVMYYFTCGFVIYFIIKILYNFFAHFIFGGV